MMVVAGFGIAVATIDAEDRPAAALFVEQVNSAVIDIVVPPKRIPGAPITRATEAETRRVRELIYVLRHLRVFSRRDEWAGALRELMEIGPPAVPELVAELDRNQRRATLSALAFALRGIGDQRAMPALIRNIPKCLQPSSSDCGVGVDDPTLLLYLQQRQNHPGRQEDNSFSFGRPVNELIPALERISGHKEPAVGNDPLRHVTAPKDPTKLAAAVAKYRTRQVHWEEWWAAHAGEFVIPEDLQTLELSATDRDLVKEAGIARFGPLFPVGPNVKLGPVREVVLMPQHIWDAASQLDLDMGRTFEINEGLIGAPLPYMMSWIKERGIDIYVGTTHDTHLWLIDDARWDTIEADVHSGRPLDLGREANSGWLYAFGSSAYDFQGDRMATFLVTTREGGRGILQAFPFDRETETQRIRYRMWERSQPLPASPQKPAPDDARTEFGEPFTVTLSLQREDAPCLFNLKTRQSGPIPAKLFPRAEQDYAEQTRLAEWANVHGFDFVSQRPQKRRGEMISFGDGDTEEEAGPSGVYGIAMFERQILATSFETISVEKAREILQRSQASYGSANFWADRIPPKAGPPTFAFQTRDGRIGLLQRSALPPGATETTFRVRLAADVKAKLDVEPTTPLKITGRALDAAGNPIAGAEVFLAEYLVEHKLLAQTTTDPLGRYEFRDVPLPFKRAEINRGNDVGAFQVFGLADGKGFAWRPMKRYYPGLTRQTLGALMLDNGDPESPDRFCPESEIELDLHFQKAVSLTGRVVNERGEALAGVQLSIRECDTRIDEPDYNIFRGGGSFEVLNQKDIVPPEIKTRVTDDQGRFTFTNLPPDCRFRTDVRPPNGSSRWVWLATKPGLKADQMGRPILSDNIEIQFRTPHKIPFDIVFADTGLPAPKVLVGCALDDVSAGGATNEAGQVVLNLPGGKGRFELLPRKGTPYLLTNGAVEIPDEPAADFRARLAVDRAAVLELTVIDAQTGLGLENCQLRRDIVDRIPDGLGGIKTVTREEEYFFRSYEQETRIAHVERPKTDKDGRLRALFPPGSHQIGLMVASWPKGYRPVEPGPTAITCQAGETVQLTLKMRKME